MAQNLNVLNTKRIKTNAIKVFASKSHLLFDKYICYFCLAYVLALSFFDLPKNAKPNPIIKAPITVKTKSIPNELNFTEKNLSKNGTKASRFGTSRKNKNI
ncbi:hypothetical protein CQA40_03395 [Helicobacter sp. MIT 01-3238]|nr:hypothetical protein CQA40_03395 [Helicobacter sp. MIT 01-3238]